MQSQSLMPMLLSRLTARLPRKGRLWWFSALIWFLLIAPAQAALELRVAIEKEVSQVKVGSSTKAVVRDESGKPLGEVAAMNAFYAEAKAGEVALDRWKGRMMWVEPSAGGYVYIGDRWYRGRTLVVPTGSGLTAVNYVDMEQYLYSVLGGEMNGNWPQEALKAQAVAARSYALYHRQRRLSRMYDLGDTTASQVYRGIMDESVGTQTAVNATAGMVLTHNNQIIEAVFHSSSGGHTENSEYVWTEARPYLRAVPDFDQGTPVYEWNKTFTREELSRRVTGVGNILALEPLEKTPTGRILVMRVVGDTGSRTISGATLQRALDLRSNLFTVTPQLGPVASKSNDNKTVPANFIVNGRGFGHGAGLSQWGAYNLALKGYSFDRIVGHYYQNSRLARVEVQ